MTKREALRARLQIPAARLDALNDLLLDPNTRVVNDLLDVIARYGTPEEINRKAAAARRARQFAAPAGRARLPIP